MLPAAGLTLNQFGLDGAALWSNVAAGNDPRADLIGKNLASMLVMVPLATVSAFVCAAFTHGWAYLPLTPRARARDLRGPARRGRRDVGEDPLRDARTGRTRSRSTPGRAARRCSPASRRCSCSSLLLLPIAVLAGTLLTTQSLAIATVVVVIVANAYGARSGSPVATSPGAHGVLAPAGAARGGLTPPSRLTAGRRRVRGRGPRGRSGRGTR